MITGAYKVIASSPDSSHGHPFLVFDRAGMLHFPLTVAAKAFVDRTSINTTRTYLNAVLPYFTWLETDRWQVRAGRQWDNPPDSVRQAIDDYLIQRLQCRIRVHHNGFQVVEALDDDRSTLRIFLSGLKLFYGSLILEGLYPFPDNPLVDGVARMSARALADWERKMGESRKFPPMPGVAGTDEPGRMHRLSENYFRIQGDEWIPQIVDDVKLPGLVVTGGSRVKGWGLREECITRILFESGARIAEVLALTLRDWTVRGLLREATRRIKAAMGAALSFYGGPMRRLSYSTDISGPSAFGMILPMMELKPT